MVSCSVRIFCKFCFHFHSRSKMQHKSRMLISTGAVTGFNYRNPTHIFHSSSDTTLVDQDEVAGSNSDFARPPDPDSLIR